MALTASTHHTAQQNGAPRSQTTATRARKVEEHETNDALRRQTAPPLGARPGTLAEPGPQRSDGSLRRSSENTPLLVVATLAAAADGVDAATLAFLTARALEDRRKEEQEEREKEKMEKDKKALRRFSGWVFMLPDSQGQCGFIESDEAKAAIALERDFPFSASYLKSFDVGDHVTFSVRRGLLEAVDLEVQW